MKKYENGLFLYYISDTVCLTYKEACDYCMKKILILTQYKNQLCL